MFKKAAEGRKTAFWENTYEEELQKSGSRHPFDREGVLMLCRIADWYVEVPAVGDMEERCQAYRVNEDKKADIVIRTEDFEPERWPGCCENVICYMETARLFYWNILHLDGMMLHSAAVEYKGKAYLFSGPSTVGKSTHTRLWREEFGEEVQFFNDDKPALRCIDGVWYAYGTPWCGKDGINQNKKVPLVGICYLKQAQENKIRRLPEKEAMVNTICQSTRKLPAADKMVHLLSIVDKLVRQIPMYELENLPVPEAARLSYETMRPTEETR